MFKKIVIIFLISILSVYIVFNIILTFVFLIYFKYPNILDIREIDGVSYKKKVPIKYISHKHDMTQRPMISVIANNNWRYSISFDKKSQNVYVTINRLVLGGFAVCYAKYEIEDKNIVEELKSNYFLKREE